MLRNAWIPVLIVMLSCGDIIVPVPDMGSADFIPVDPGPTDPGSKDLHVDPGSPDVPDISCKAHKDCTDIFPGIGPCEESVCNPQTWTCMVRKRSDGSECDDLNPCTLDDWCENAMCVGRPAECDDDNPCTDDFCNENGDCAVEFNEEPCEDGNQCTDGDKCIGGDCNPGPGVPCDDGNDCTEQWCEQDKGCIYEFKDNCISCGGDDDCKTENQCTEGHCQAGKCDWAILNGKECNDGNACTVKDVCKQLFCQGQEDKDCNDDNPCTNDFCDSASGCLHEYNNSLCEEGDPCTQGDFCDGGVCNSGAPVNCNDGNECTDDFCSPDATCPSGTITEPGTGSNTACCHVGMDCNDGKECTEDNCDKELGCSHTNICDQPNPYCTKLGCRCGVKTVCGSSADTCKFGFGDSDGTCVCGSSGGLCEKGVCCNGKCCDPNQCCNTATGQCSNACLPGDFGNPV